MLTKEVVEELKAKYADRELRKVTTKSGDVVVASPKRGDWQRMQDEVASKPDKRAETMRTLVRSCVVYPSKEEFLSMLERRPGLTETLLPIVQEMGGVEEDLQGEEL